MFSIIKQFQIIVKRFFKFFSINSKAYINLTIEPLTPNSEHKKSLEKIILKASNALNDLRIIFRLWPSSLILLNTEHHRISLLSNDKDSDDNKTVFLNIL